MPKVAEYRLAWSSSQNIFEATREKGNKRCLHKILHHYRISEGGGFASGPGLHLVLLLALSHWVP